MAFSADDIADLREIERESLRRKLFGTTHDWMKGEFDHYKRLDTELARRQFKYSPTESVFRMRAETRKTIEKFLFAESPLDRPRQGRVATPLATAPVSSASPEQPSPEPDGRAAAPPGAVSDPEISNVRSETSSAGVAAQVTSSPSEAVAIVTQDSRLVEKPAQARPSPGEEGAGEGDLNLSSASVSSARSVVDSDSGDPNAHDESIVIGPHESARSILERCGVKLPNHPNMRLIRPV